MSLVWLKAEVQHARHDGRMMIIENTNRFDHEATAIPQAQLPARPTTSVGVLYWRQQLLFRQRMQREFVMRADVARIRHVTMMGAITGVSSVGSARIRTHGAGRGRITETGNPREGLRPTHASVGSAKVVFRMEPRLAACPEPLTQVRRDHSFAVVARKAHVCLQSLTEPRPSGSAPDLLA